jgi:hypothetical protein
VAAVVLVTTGTGGRIVTSSVSVSVPLELIALIDGPNVPDCVAVPEIKPVDPSSINPPGSPDAA